MGQAIGRDAIPTAENKKLERRFNGKRLDCTHASGRKIENGSSERLFKRRIAVTGIIDKAFNFVVFLIFTLFPAIFRPEQLP